MVVIGMKRSIALSLVIDETGNACDSEPLAEGGCAAFDDAGRIMHQDNSSDQFKFYGTLYRICSAVRSR